MFERSLRISSLLALAFVALNHVAARALGWPLATDAIAEWIMARTPSIPEEEYHAVLKFVGECGYDLNRIQKVPQKW